VQFSLPQQVTAVGAFLSDPELRTIGKLQKRIVPFLVVCYFTAYLDRVNVGFAAITMNKDLGFTPIVFGWGAGIFFLGYVLLAVPSNLMLERLGARRWIATIMAAWGLVSLLMSFIWNERSFFVVRFLLGAAESGFFPGIILYMTTWFPARYRAQMIAYFSVSIPVSMVVGSPISGLLLNMDGLFGVRGWRWLFVLEALPPLLLSAFVLRYLTDRPDGAAWLEPDERQWLTAELEAERKSRERVVKHTLWQAVGNVRVLSLGVAYSGIVACNYGISFWLPQIVHGFGLSTVRTGLVTAIPYVCAAIGVVYWGRRSDRTGERKWHAVVPSLVVAAGLSISTAVHNPVSTMIVLSIAGFGMFANLPVFWTLPPVFLSDTAVAGGIAVVSSMGSMSGFVAPYVMGYSLEATGSFAVGLLTISTYIVISILLIPLIGRHAWERVESTRVGRPISP
jgi:ACS family tartrate transporter-like MFS transporter